MTLQLDSSEGEENEENPAEGQHVTLLVQPLEAYSLSAQVMIQFFMCNNLLEFRFMTMGPYSHKSLFFVLQENFFLEKIEQVATVCPENPSADHKEGDCSQSLEAAEHSLDPQFCCDPPEDSKELLRDYKQTVEATSYHDILQEDCPDVEFQIKREAESPDIKTGRNIDINADVRQRMSYDTYTRSVDHPIGPTPLDIPGPMLDSHALNLPNQHTNAYISSYEPHFGGDSEPSTNPQQIKRPSKYVCDFCNKTFSYPSDLKRHRLSHTQERTHVCGMCGKAFITRSHLRRHELMHIDVQPSVCSICGHKTSRLAYLKIHMKMHIKNKHV